MLAFENKNLWDCYFPLQPAKRILNAPDERFSNWWISFFECLNFDTVRTAAANMVRNSFLFNTVSLDWSKLHWANLDGADFYFPWHAAAVACAPGLLCVLLPPENQPEHQCHSDKWIVTGQAYQCQCRAALRDFDSALFPQLNRRLCFAKQTNKQRTWRVWWKSKQHGPVTCPTTMTLPK